MFALIPRLVKVFGGYLHTLVHSFCCALRRKSQRDAFITLSNTSQGALLRLAETTVGTAVLLVISVVSTVVFPQFTYIASASEQTRIEVSHDRQPQGWGSVPHTAEEAAAQGYVYKAGWSPANEGGEGKSTIYSEVTSGGKDYGHYWEREIEIVPVGEQPSVEGVTYYVRDEGDFPNPDLAPKIQNIQNYWDPTNNTPNPAYRFTNQSVTETFLSRNGGQVLLLKSGNQWFYCINPNSIAPSQLDSYMMVPTKYSPQTNFRDVPELTYILRVLMKNTGIFPRANDPTSGAPLWDDAYTALANEYKAIMSGTATKATLDPRLSVSEVKRYLDNLTINAGSAPIVDGERMRAQADFEDPQRRDLAVALPSRDEEKRRVALGIEYTMVHYTQGMPLADLDQMEVESSISASKDENSSITARAFVRLLVAYTQAARDKGLLSSSHEKVLNIRNMTSHNDGSYTTFSFTFTDSDANTLVFKAPDNLTNKLEYVKNSYYAASYNDQKGSYIGYYAFNKNATYQIRVNNDLTIEQRESLRNVVAEYTTNNSNMLGMSYMPRSTFRQDPKTGHWLVKQWVAVPKSVAPGASESKQGYSRGQQVAGFSDTSGATLLRMNLSLVPEPSLRTIVSASPVTTGVSISATQTSPDGSTVAAPAVLSPMPAELGEKGTYAVAVKDTITYENLTVKQRYLAYGQLMKIVEGQEPQVVAASSIQFTASEADANNSKANKVTLHFGNIELETGTKYVVFEQVSPVNNVSNASLFTRDGAIAVNKATGKVERSPEYSQEEHVTRHENTDDLAQTIIVSHPATVRTQVEADGVKAVLAGVDDNTEDAISQEVTLNSQSIIDSGRGTVLTKSDGTISGKVRIPVVDHVRYTGLDSNKQYLVWGLLMKVVTASDGNSQATPVASKTVVFSPQNTSGTAINNGAITNAQSLYEAVIDVNFGQVTLETGATYIVFEEVSPLSNVLNAASISERTPARYKNERIVIKHRELNDAAQTVVTAPVEPQTIMELPEAGVDWWILVFAGGIPFLLFVSGVTVGIIRRRNRATTKSVSTK